MDLESLDRTRLRVSKVTISIRFNEVSIERRMAVIMVRITRDVFVLLRSLTRRFLVVRVTLLRTRRNVRVINDVCNITRPISVTSGMTFALVCLSVCISILLIRITCTIFRSLHVAVAVLMMFISRFLLIFLPSLEDGLLQFRRDDGLTDLINLNGNTLQRRSALSLSVQRFLIAISNGLIGLSFLFLVCSCIRSRLTLIDRVITLISLSFDVLRSLIVRMFLNGSLNAIRRIEYCLHALGRARLLLRVLALTFLRSRMISIESAESCYRVSIGVGFFARSEINDSDSFERGSVFPVTLSNVNGDIT